MNKRNALLTTVSSLILTIILEFALYTFVNNWLLRVISFIYFFFGILWLIADIYYLRLGHSSKSCIINDIIFLLAGFVFLLICTGIFILCGEILSNILFTCIIAVIFIIKFVNS